MNPFRKLFGPRLDPFLLELAQGQLWVVSLNTSNEAGFRFSEASNEEIRELVLRNAQETAGNQAKRLLEYDKDGRHILPVFSSSEAVGRWLRTKPIEMLPDL